ncbi:glutathione S-transferase [Leptolyngbya sp. 'hensonii']|uniref:glutathione S-transferase family protein n=1 Tax=Leptolyngbya sp. 'hensonii' TaxID=1922337 RepID=UPI00094F71AC|nr:glutathione S-transferase family protein [Leptolyngbya sp. 'hensonii']OLP18154.1 glutathione S-transferase [Leptolyngbya sp. 'hensonii']
MLKLYGGARSRATIVKWYLEELQLPYEFVQLDMQAGEHLRPPYTEINPLGKVPAIVDGDFKLWESGAILIYLADKYDQTLTSPEDRALISQWALCANATMSAMFVEATREKEMPRLLPPLNQLLQNQPFFLGDRFTAADVAMGATLFYAILMLGINYEAYPAIADYIGRLKQRPAFQKIFGG